MKFNINNTVRVRLTDYGRKIHREQYDLLRRDIPSYKADYVLPEKDGWSTWQLWCLMMTFGPYLANGATPPFEPDIEILRHRDTQMKDPNSHSAVAATIWDVLQRAVAKGVLDPFDAGPLAISIAEKLAKAYKLNLGRRS